MKENTILHFGNSESKYSIYWKVVSRGGKRGKGRRYFLRQTPASSTQSTEVRITSEQVAQFQSLLPESAGMELVEARINLAAGIAAAAKRPQRIQFAPRVAEAHTEPELAAA